MNIDTELGFGKYAGVTPRELLKDNKGLYLMWCLENIKNFRLEPLELERAIRSRYYKQYIAVYRKRKS